MTITPKELMKIEEGPACPVCGFEMTVCSGGVICQFCGWQDPPSRGKLDDPPDDWDPEEL